MSSKKIVIKEPSKITNKEKIKKIDPNILEFLANKDNLKQIFNKKKSLKNDFIKDKIMKNVLKRNKSIVRQKRKNTSKRLKIDEIDLMIGHLFELNRNNDYLNIKLFLKNNRRQKCLKILNKLNINCNSNAPLPIIKNIIFNMSFNDIRVIHK
tara:strand:- start:15901 stop:16359 length:459 start_codon:yes stop_codon:yes gene_type:complete